MPFCGGCRKELPQGASFCTNCGQRVETASTGGETQAPPEAGAAKYEYKTITLAQKGLGWFTSRSIPELEETLNREARLGWRLRELLMPSGIKGESDKVILVLERELR